MEGGRVGGPLRSVRKPRSYGFGGLPDRTTLVDELFDANGSNVVLATVAVFVM
jgi:hypothetical protein